MKFYKLDSQLKQDLTTFGIYHQKFLKKSINNLNEISGLFNEVDYDTYLGYFAPEGRKKPKKIVIITAHDDDILGYSGTLARFIDGGVKIYHIILTDGSQGFGESALLEFISKKELKELVSQLLIKKDSDEGFLVCENEDAKEEYINLLTKAGRKTSKIRLNETRSAEKVLGIEKTIFMMFPDTTLTSYNYTYGLEAIVLRIVRDLRPHTIIIQDHLAPFDYNPDHYAAAYFGKAIHGHISTPALGISPISPPKLIRGRIEGIKRPDSRIPDLLTLLDEKYWNRKYESLLEYKSQLGIIQSLAENKDELKNFMHESFFIGLEEPIKLEHLSP
ncbi:MAG: PIG-L deacetylase family protein [Candidatus Helarchaeota archaeon]